MNSRFSRRRMMQGLGMAAFAPAIQSAQAAPADRKWPIEEGADTPKLCLAPGDGGGPLPASVQPPAAAAGAPGAGRGGRGFGGYGGFLAPGKDPAAASPAPGTPGPGGRGNLNLAAAYQRIRQLGVTHL